MATFLTVSEKISYLKTETSLRPNYGTNREYTVVGTPTKLTGNLGKASDIQYCMWYRRGTVIP